MNKNNAELIDLLKKAGTNFFDCSGPEASRKAVTELLKAMPQVDLMNKLQN